MGIAQEGRVPEVSLAEAVEALAISISHLFRQAIATARLACNFIARTSTQENIFFHVGRGVRFLGTSSPR